MVWKCGVRLFIDKKIFQFSSRLMADPFCHQKFVLSPFYPSIYIRCTFGPISAAGRTAKPFCHQKFVLSLFYLSICIRCTLRPISSAGRTAEPFCHQKFFLSPLLFLYIYTVHFGAHQFCRQKGRTVLPSEICSIPFFIHLYLYGALWGPSVLQAERQNRSAHQFCWQNCSAHQFCQQNGITVLPISSTGRTVMRHGTVLPSIAVLLCRTISSSTVLPPRSVLPVKYFFVCRTVHFGKTVLHCEVSNSNYPCVLFTVFLYREFYNVYDHNCS